MVPQGDEDVGGAVLGLAVRLPRRRGHRTGRRDKAVEVGAQDAVEQRPVGSVAVGRPGAVEAEAVGDGVDVGGNGGDDAGVVIAAEEFTQALLEGHAGVVAAAVGGGILLQDDDVAAQTLELDAVHEAAEGAADLERQVGKRS